ncbi:tyrosine-type recombinase/integrase [Streptomyces sp. NPDC093510]|uniref:tyrosine-type recombinase/integrase n=1 Tax=Streptomyces sp. NPDC093510 TaxID=3155199 RepID=UPI00342A7BF2
MAEDRRVERDLKHLVVPEAGRLEETGAQWEPYRLLDGDDLVIAPVAVYFAELLAAHRSLATLRSYGNDLLRWWRFLVAVGVPWDRAVRADARDFIRWMQVADKPVRTHWRYRDRGSSAPVARAVRRGPPPGSVNPVTGKATPGRKYSPATRAHAETVLRSFYDFQLEEGRGPVINPFPLDRGRRAGRAHAHHNPLDTFQPVRRGRYRPAVVRRAPRRIPDEQFNELFSKLRYLRDCALLAFWISTGARTVELLSALQRDAVPGDQLISVTRKGSGDVQQLPASPDAFVWLRLYQQEAWRQGVPRGRAAPLWWTLRRPWRPLTYDAARAMFRRVAALLGANWTLYDLRHTAAYRMARDPQLPLTDVQWILGHRRLTTTQLYVPPGEEEMIASLLAYFARRDRPLLPEAGQQVLVPEAGQQVLVYDPESLDILFGGAL